MTVYDKLNGLVDECLMAVKGAIEYILKDELDAQARTVNEVDDMLREVIRDLEGIDFNDNIGGNAEKIQVVIGLLNKACAELY